jgi:hypothetical protein
MGQLSGWNKIGIIASVVWILGAGSLTYYAVGNYYFNEARFWCVKESTNIQRDMPACSNPDIVILYFPNVRETAVLASVLVALIPVPVGWVCVYLILFLKTGVERGFMRAGNSN